MSFKNQVDRPCAIGAGLIDLGEDVARGADRGALHGMGFIDARPALRAAAATRAIHGPIDWLHLNHAGYQALGDFLTRRLRMSDRRIPAAERNVDRQAIAPADRSGITPPLCENPAPPHAARGRSSRAPRA
jgi:hypothetical protein